MNKTLVTLADRELSAVRGGWGHGFGCGGGGFGVGGFGGCGDGGLGGFGFRRFGFGGFGGFGDGGCGIGYGDSDCGVETDYDVSACNTGCGGGLLGGLL